MKMSKKSLCIGLIFTVLFLFACVTINIYFPAEKVESVAGDIVDDIRKYRSGEKEKPLKKDQGSGLFRILASVNLSSAAWAEEATTVSNPTIRALKEKMKARFEQMKPFYRKGALKEGNDGYVALGDTGGLGLKEKRDLGGYMDAENSDRRALYAEVAKALKIDPSQVNRIAEIFAKEWQKSVK